MLKSRLALGFEPCNTFAEMGNLHRIADCVKDFRMATLG